MTAESSTARRKMLIDGCPRCGGDLMRDETEYVCLQCGRMVPLPKEIRREMTMGKPRLPVLPFPAEKRRGNSL
jgi:uncharacterized Zn finger protein (UPF0148 family)